MRRLHFVCLFILGLSSIFLFAGCDQPDTSEIVTPIEVVTEVDFANAKCPIMGGKPTAELTVEYEGQTIGFCCDGCPEKWAALSAQEQADKFASVRVVASEAQ